MTVAKEIELKDAIENLGANGQGSGEQTSDVAGDGTTTATFWPRPSTAKA